MTRSFKNFSMLLEAMESWHKSWHKLPATLWSINCVDFCSQKQLNLQDLPFEVQGPIAEHLFWMPIKCPIVSNNSLWKIIGKWKWETDCFMEPIVAGVALRICGHSILNKQYQLLCVHGCTRQRLNLMPSKNIDLFRSQTSLGSTQCHFSRTPPQKVFAHGWSSSFKYTWAVHLQSYQRSA